MQYRCYVSSFRCGCTLCLAVFIAGDCYDVGTSYWGWLCGTNYVRTKVNSFPISWPILSDNNLLTVSEMERNELLALIVFLEHVPRFFCSLFAEILISGLYYSLRTPFLHLLCAIRRHLFLRAFRYILFFFLSSLCSDLGLLPVLPQSWNCICCTKLCTWFRGRLSPFWTLYLVTLNWRSLRCIVNRPLLQCSGCFVCVCVCVCACVDCRNGYPVFLYCGLPCCLPTTAGYFVTSPKPQFLSVQLSLCLMCSCERHNPRYVILWCTCYRSVFNQREQKRGFYSYLCWIYCLPSSEVSRCGIPNPYRRIWRSGDLASW